jgi:transcriptional regulator with XRE-family HTH domain
VTTNVANAFQQALPEETGRRLRAARQRRHLSGRSLARIVGVSASLISQIENGKANPSVGTLYAIVTALDTSLDELFDHEPATAAVDESSPVRSDHGVLRYRNRSSIDLGSGVRWERLTPSGNSEVDFLFVTYGVGGESCAPDSLMCHNGREYGLVLTGQLGATCGFDNYVLAPGDSIVLESSAPHRFWTVGDEPAVVVWFVIGRGGINEPDPSS